MKPKINRDVVTERGKGPKSTACTREGRKTREALSPLAGGVAPRGCGQIDGGDGERVP